MLMQVPNRGKMEEPTLGILFLDLVETGLFLWIRRMFEGSVAAVEWVVEESRALDMMEGHECQEFAVPYPQPLQVDRRSYT